MDYQMFVNFYRRKLKIYFAIYAFWSIPLTFYGW